MKKINFKFFIKYGNKKMIPNLVSGFTLIETMFAVFILTSTIVGLMTIVSNSLFAARYARDEITINYLLQEAIDYIRNDRDTLVFWGSGGTWDIFWEKYGAACSGSNGCTFNVLSRENPESCNSGSGNNCPFLYYDKDADTTPFYIIDDGVNMGNKVRTNFRRKIVIRQNGTNPDEINVTVTVDWQNGNLPMTRSLKTSFLKWQ